MKRDKALIVTAVGVVLALLMALINYFEPFADESAAFTAWIIISPIWLFCLAPAYAFEYCWFKSISENMGDEEAMKKGALIGALYGSLLIILPIISAPVLAVMYYVKVLKNKK